MKTSMMANEASAADTGLSLCHFEHQWPGTADFVR